MSAPTATSTDAIGNVRFKAALFQKVQAPPDQIAPAGSNRSSRGGDERAEAFGVAAVALRGQRFSDLGALIGQELSWCW